jgi:hypothetical protein
MSETCRVEWAARDDLLASHTMSRTDAERMASTLTWAGCQCVTITSLDDPPEPAAPPGHASA